MCQVDRVAGFCGLKFSSAVHRLQQRYNSLAKPQQYTPGDLVWPSVPTADKLTLHWEGLWNVDEVRNAVNVKIPIIPTQK